MLGSDLLLRPGTFDPSYGDDDPVYPVEAGPTVRPASIVADQNTPSLPVDGLDEMHENVARNPRERDVADLQEIWVHGGDDHFVPASD